MPVLYTILTPVGKRFLSNVQLRPLNALHTLAMRRHCFQFKAESGTGSWTWLDQVWDFLVREGFVK